MKYAQMLSNEGYKQRDDTICLFHIIVLFVTIIASLMFAFFGVWNAHQAGDDAGAYKMVRWIDGEDDDKLINTYIRLLKATGGDLRTHWTPISNAILYSSLEENDRLFRIVVINLALVFMIAIIAGLFSLEVGASRWGALFASLWISTSPVLVQSIASSWGPMNILPPLFTLLATWILWRRLSNLAISNSSSTVSWRFILAYALLFILAVLSKETGVRGLALATGTWIITIIYRRDLRPLKELSFLITVLLMTVFIYFTVRYFFTEAEIPLFRPSAISTQEDYHQLRLGLYPIIKNCVLILLGAITPINSYAIYLGFIKASYEKVLFLLLPAIVWGTFLCVVWFKMFIQGPRSKTVNLSFIALMVACSLFPEALLGKVSETYGMASLWPLAILSAVVLSDMGSKKVFVCRFTIVLSVLFILTNIVSTRIKVDEIVKTGQSAHSIRRSMIDLTQNLPPGSKIAVFWKQRPKEAFGRFGERGIQANGGFYLRNNQHVWVSFSKGEAVKNLKKYDLILEESEDQMTLHTVQF